MPHRKLDYHEILYVHSLYVARGRPWLENLAPFSVRLLGHKKDAPDGTFAAVAGGLYLPKRKRGEKFVVRYATLHEKEF